MNKEELAKELAKELWKQPSMLKKEMEQVILEKLTQLLGKEYNKCEICGVPVEGGTICSDKCGDKWLATYLP